MLGAIIGDVIGSRFEFKPIKVKDFELFKQNESFNKTKKITLGSFNNVSRFTDDTVMTVAICNALLETEKDYSNLGELAVLYMQTWGRKYPLVGYGGRFNKWLMSKNPMPYNSFGNGSAMRISAVPYFAKSLDEIKKLSNIVSAVTHNHSEGIKGAEAVAVCIWLAQKGFSKEYIKQYVEANYYSLDFDYNKLVQEYKFDETCQGSVPQAIYCFLISNSFEDGIRTAVSLGGDADTMGAIVGAISEAYYGIPEEIKSQVFNFLTDEIIEIINKFYEKISNKNKGENYV